MTDVGSKRPVNAPEAGTNTEAPPRALCRRCQVKPVCYDGARFCGGACSQRWEMGDRPHG